MLNLVKLHHQIIKMEEEEKCFRNVKKNISCPKGTPKNVKCYVETKKEISCTTKKRCVDGRLKYDDLATGRVAGDRCKDSE